MHVYNSLAKVPQGYILAPTNIFRPEYRKNVYFQFAINKKNRLSTRTWKKNVKYHVYNSTYHKIYSNSYPINANKSHSSCLLQE